MFNLNQLSLILFSLIWVTILFFAFLDFRKKRKLTSLPAISFIVPCYNGEKTVEETIRGIYSSYKKNKIDLIVINDHSTDCSLDILKKLRKEYGFRLINNEKNLGKSRSINNIYPLSRHDLIWIVDSDVVINKGAIISVLSRFQTDSKLAAVNCAYTMKNRGWWSIMQQMESNMMSLLLLSHNLLSTLYIWGGCVAIRKKQFKQVGGFSENILTEDADLAFKLNEHGFHVQHSISSVEVYGVDGFYKWIKQRVRWIAGTVQCYLKYIHVWIKHSLHVVFLLMFTALSLTFIFFLLHELFFLNAFFEDFELLRQSGSLLLSLKVAGLYYGFMFTKTILSRFYFAFFSVPLILLSIKKIKEVYKILYIFPFTLIYFPILSVVAIYAGLKAIITYPSIKKTKRAW